MTSEHERLLAEGPRTAPEPPTAPGRDGSLPAPPVPSELIAPEPDVFSAEPLDTQPASPQPDVFASPPGSTSPGRLGLPGSGSGRRSRSTRPAFARLIVPLVVMTLIIARSAFGGHGGGSAIFLAVWVAAIGAGIFFRRRRW